METNEQYLRLTALDRALSFAEGYRGNPNGEDVLVVAAKFEDYLKNGRKEDVK